CNKKIFASFIKDKQTINTARPAKIDGLRPTLIRK
ncbi:uncharacterized protein METZ01_LOCUS386362, partial [marine metagenome]